MSVLKEGRPFIIPSLAAGFVLLIASIFVKMLPLSITIASFGCLSVVFSLFCIFFFRDPKIKITKGEGLILSPCNGTVMEVIEDGDEKIIRVFLSIFSVHLQRSPVSGTVANVTHKDGKFLAAWNPRAHIENEQNIFTINGEGGVYTVRQIAGLVARRCVSWVKSGDVLKAGDKIGMIKFGSQVDLHLPKQAEIKVKPGGKVQAGITVAALLNAVSPDTASLNATLSMAASSGVVK
uniref:Phosphatidylserine decarboxylase n=1 Tax=uncultured bacterium contig00027 TaxID=1181516 RepID=A0A806K124_9BACT|nr:phosphatidylserine decarboxylase [uncultured bacterium contig00027]